ncbi:hypothetical protein [Autumnicola musiva]|uniref:Uncharacterized protein n=1 Tax=Autumnicola musiva TaxID=3075589 RepID=A0ABU3D9E0_9FLAO|nr:hypothetical protein [Zunongwangia sp. F117]MDT0678148.1 hypothetical protein [Zunongwangia sp. F117]
MDIQIPQKKLKAGVFRVDNTGIVEAYIVRNQEGSAFMVKPPTPVDGIKN